MRFPLAVRQLVGDLLVACVVAAFALLISTDLGSLVALWWLGW